MVTDKVLINDIIESIKIISHYLKDCSLEDLQNDLMRQDAIIRRFEIIGEAASKVSDPLKKKYNAIDWRDMKSMRNFLIHDYKNVTIKLIFETSKTILPAQLEKLKEIEII